jgi:putative DNA primase/helicase
MNIQELTNGRWPDLLAHFCGLTAKQLSDKHQPCPLCGGDDRYRFDDLDGNGSWYCNQCGGKDHAGGGGNGMDLLMRHQKWPYPEACKRIEQHLGIRPEPPIKNAEHVWRYNDDFYVCRFPGKRIRPLWFDGIEWKWTAPPAPRPLYNRESIAARPDAPVLVVEGEKTADAAAKLFPSAIAITWPSGCKAINKADWAPLVGRKCVLWPDADSPGIQAMDKLQAKLLDLGAAQVRVVTPPSDVSEGWDLANAEWSTAEAGAYLKANRSEPIAATKAPLAPLLLAEVGIEPELKKSDKLPFRCLGFDRGSYFYLPLNGGQVLEFTASQHTKLNLLNLAPLAWWNEAYKKGTGADWDRAADCLIALCMQQGVYDPDRVRGRGAWYDRGRVMVHLGNRLIVDNHEHDICNPPPTNYFYEQAKPLDGPTEAPLCDELATKIRNIAIRFRWEMPVNAYFLLGWTVLAPVCGALDWRPHAWITGAAGTGKTCILKDFLRPLMGGIYQAATGGTTEAGLRGTLCSDAIPVIFDEFEQNEQRDKQIVQNVLALARIASSEGGKIYKGTTTGGANAFEIRSMFCVSSINVALIQKADVDRFCVLALRKDTIEKQEWTAFESEIKTTITMDIGRQLIARTIQHIPTIRSNAKILARALALTFGQRYGDQYGTLLAGAWSLSAEGGKLLQIEEAQEWIKSLNWESNQIDSQDADEVKCLDFILNAMIPADNKKITIREILLKARLGAMIGDEPADVILARYGMKYHETSLAIANGHSILQSLLRDTPWSGGAYRQALQRIDGAERVGPIRFGATVKRCTLIPLKSAGIVA